MGKVAVIFQNIDFCMVIVSLQIRMPKFATFFVLWSWRLKITFQYGGCKQSLGGIVPENSCEMQMPRYRRCRDKEGFELVALLVSL